MSIDPHTIQLKQEHDYLAPDGSEIYLLANGENGGLCQCTLPVGGISSAVLHNTVEELWYFIDGEGEVWRENVCDNKPIKVQCGTSLIIPVRTAFQFRNTGKAPLKFVIATIPRWPGPQEAVATRGIWSL